MSVSIEDLSASTSPDPEELEDNPVKTMVDSCNAGIAKSTIDTKNRMPTTNIAR